MSAPAKNNKRKLEEEMTPEEVDAIEEQLYSVVYNKCGERAERIAHAHVMMTNALEHIKRARAILDEPAVVLDQAEIVPLLNEFSAKYKEVDVPQSVKKRNPDEFDRFSNEPSDKQKAEIAKHAASDKMYIDAMKRRKAAVEKLKKRSQTLLNDMSNKAEFVYRASIQEVPWSSRQNVSEQARWRVHTFK